MTVVWARGYDSHTVMLLILAFLTDSNFDDDGVTLFFSPLLLLTASCHTAAGAMTKRRDHYK